MKIDNPILLGEAAGFGIPSAGTSGQVLRKVDGTNYNTQWVDNGLPAGGTSGQSLVKNSSTSGDASWVNYIPTGGTSGQVLRKVDGTNYNTQWANNGLPTGGTSGQILVKNSSTSGDASWTNLTYASLGITTVPAAQNSDMTPTLLAGSGITVSGNVITIERPGIYLLNASIAIRATYAEYAWVDASNNRLTGTNTGLSVSANSVDPAGPANAMGIVNITSANTIIKLRILSGVTFNLTQAGQYAGATIVQIR